MASRRDQLQSYQFLTQRVLSALVMRETDPAQSPLRRGVGAVFVGLMLTVLVSAGFGIYGLLTKVGSNNWKTEGAVVVEKESGASYVYLGGKLHPTLNYASALLAAGQTTPQVFRVSSNSLAGVARTTMIGIPGAPNSLPPANRTAGLPWTLCSAPGVDDSGNRGPIVTLAVGRGPVGGRPLGEDKGLLVTDGKLTALVWKGHRYQLRGSSVVVPALFSAAAPTSVGSAWLNGLPAGIDLGMIPPPQPAGGASAATGFKVGQLLMANTASGALYYLVYPDGLVRLTPLQKALLLNPPQPVTVRVEDAEAAPRSGQLVPPADDSRAPTEVPQLADNAPGDLLCARTDDGRTVGALTIGGSLDTSGATPTGSRTLTGTPLANQVLVPAGYVAVVKVLSSPAAQTGPYALVTDVGARYSVPSEQALQMLGYQPAQAVGVPATLVAQIPPGPALDPAAATRPASAAPPAN
jgi:type VII secretion protein EccB